MAKAKRDREEKDFKEILKGIEKDFGKNTLFEFGKVETLDIEAISTGSYTLDEAIGIGGVPRGRIVEVYGNESSGKTTVCLTVVANAQKAGNKVAYIDVENALDPKYCKLIGVDIDKMWVSQPDCGEDALKIVQRLVESNEFSVVVVDSVSALVPRAELEGEIGDSHMALQARLMSQSLRMVSKSVRTSNTCLIFINQTRMKIGVMFGSPVTTSGGNALKFYASTRLQTARISNVKDKEEIIGSRIKVKVVKNKVAAPFREAQFEIWYDRGINNTVSIFENAVDKDVILKEGNTFSFAGEKLAVGKAKVITYLEENKEILDEIYKVLTIDKKESNDE